ncbi:MAG: RNA polymerase sigma factor, partial [bacterium]
MMNAVISGQSGVALLVDGDRLTSIHADTIEERVPRQPADLPFLFGDCSDLQFMKDIAPDEAADHLKRAYHSEEALQLSLILLDPELSQEVRKEAAEALEELLIDDYVSQHVRSVLYAYPLPDRADLVSAIGFCKQGPVTLVWELLNTLHKFQPHILKIRLAWEAIPDATFGSAEARAQYHAAAVRGGAFRDLVMTIANGQSVDNFLMKILQNPSVKILPELQSILHLWITPFRYKFTISAEPIKQQGLSPKIDSEWIASRQDAVGFYLWKKWHLRGDDLENVLQETMTAALQSFSKYEGRSRAEPGIFLNGIAKNVARSYFRRLHRQDRRLAPLELAEGIGVNFNDAAEADALAKLLREKLSALPKKYVQVLELIFYQDYREKEAAKKLGIPVDRLYSIKSDALKRLRKLCAKDARFEFNLIEKN